MLAFFVSTHYVQLTHGLSSTSEMRPWLERAMIVRAFKCPGFVRSLSSDTQRPLCAGQRPFAFRQVQSSLSSIAVHGYLIFHLKQVFIKRTIIIPLIVRIVSQDRGKSCKPHCSHDFVRTRHVRKKNWVVQSVQRNSFFETQRRYRKICEQWNKKSWRLARFFSLRTISSLETLCFWTQRNAPLYH